MLTAKVVTNIGGGGILPDWGECYQTEEPGRIIQITTNVCCTKGKTNTMLPKRYRPMRLCNGIV